MGNKIARESWDEIYEEARRGVPKSTIARKYNVTPPAIGYVLSQVRVLRGEPPSQAMPGRSDGASPKSRRPSPAASRSERQPRRKPAAWDYDFIYIPEEDRVATAEEALPALRSEERARRADERDQGRKRLLAKEREAVRHEAGRTEAGKPPEPAEALAPDERRLRNRQKRQPAQRDEATPGSEVPAGATAESAPEAAPEAPSTTAKAVGRGSGPLTPEERRQRKIERDRTRRVRIKEERETARRVAEQAGLELPLPAEASGPAPEARALTPEERRQRKIERDRARRLRIRQERELAQQLAGRARTAAEPAASEPAASEPPQGTPRSAQSDPGRLLTPQERKIERDRARRLRIRQEREAARRLAEQAGVEIPLPSKAPSPAPEARALTPEERRQRKIERDRARRRRINQERELAQKLAGGAQAVAGPDAPEETAQPTASPSGHGPEPAETAESEARTEVRFDRGPGPAATADAAPEPARTPEERHQRKIERDRARRLRIKQEREAARSRKSPAETGGRSEARAAGAGETAEEAASEAAPEPEPTGASPTAETEASPEPPAPAAARGVATESAGAGAETLRETPLPSDASIPHEAAPEASGEAEADLPEALPQRRFTRPVREQVVVHGGKHRATRVVDVVRLTSGNGGTLRASKKARERLTLSSMATGSWKLPTPDADARMSGSGTPDAAAHLQTAPQAPPPSETPPSAPPATPPEEPPALPEEEPASPEQSRLVRSVRTVNDLLEDYRRSQDNAIKPRIKEAIKEMQRAAAAVEIYLLKA